MVILLLMMDPLGNVPVLVPLLKSIEPRRRVAIVVRECLIAYDVLLVFIFFGERLLSLLGLSGTLLNIAGGEPFIVPIAIPFIAGPTAMATVVLMASRSPERMADWILALSAAITTTLIVLLFAERIGTWIGERGILALERLMGLLLTAIATEMLLRGIETFVRQLQAG